MAATPSSRNKGFADERYRALIGRLVEARKEAQLSQGALATRLQRHQQFVSRYETGERRLDVVEFMDIAAALNVDGENLLRTLDKAKS
ncbi:helix-turn-helix domain-containing protein [Sphingomonas sp. PL-96]|uniref:helix-turn-helix domain-containing protein n=1 Tax=Sphingomonas sp. PL-96 TaxID=2887201 RepID=UPI001E50FA5A|nr:helix-turn-helix transcriptional regulator [Sphingomonas sp. PL-96]MCC2975708.1 helix-turn-helix domain-containing protein [Sphingomonas sp. PL-96]